MARLTTDSWPMVNGSKDPGKMAILSIFCFVYSGFKVNILLNCWELLNKFVNFLTFKPFTSGHEVHLPVSAVFYSQQFFQVAGFILPSGIAFVCSIQNLQTCPA